jgi:hypothetical protein
MLCFDAGPGCANLMNTIRDYFLEGTESTNNIKAIQAKRLRYAFDLPSSQYLVLCDSLLST